MQTKILASAGSYLDEHINRFLKANNITRENLIDIKFSVGSDIEDLDRKYALIIWEQK